MKLSGDSRRLGLPGEEVAVRCGVGMAALVGVRLGHEAVETE
jgi:hypothetical protein